MEAWKVVFLTYPMRSIHVVSFQDLDISNVIIITKE